MYVSVTELFRNLCDLRQLLCGKIAADHTKPEGKVILLFLPHESALF